MNEITVEAMTAVGKGKTRVVFSTGLSCLLYAGEIRQLHLEKDAVVSETEYNKILNDIVGKRAKKRAMYLLEKMDRTEKQLTDKLSANEYPAQCIESAIQYVKDFHYLDDQRYASNYVRYMQEKKSRQIIKMDLMNKGVARELIETALEEEYCSDEQEQIKYWLEKRHYDSNENDPKEFRRHYNFLLRKGFRSNEILKIMNLQEG